MVIVHQKLTITLMLAKLNSNELRGDDVKTNSKTKKYIRLSFLRYCSDCFTIIPHSFRPKPANAEAQPSYRYTKPSIPLTARLTAEA